jgi:DNA-binding NarL/FixJ family response regulator
VGGLGATESAAEDTVELRRVAAPDLTRREVEVLNALCRPALRHEAFVAPATAKDIADELVVTEAAVKQHLLRLYQKFRIPEGGNRRGRLANEVIALGVVRPQPTGDEVRRAG